MSDKENRIRANILKTITLALTMAVTGNAAANTKTSEKDNNRQDPKLEQTDNGVSKSKLSHEKSDTKFIGTDEWGSEIYEKSDGSIVIRMHVKDENDIKRDTIDPSNTTRFSSFFKHLTSNNTHYKAGKEIGRYVELNENGDTIGTGKMEVQRDDEGNIISTHCIPDPEKVKKNPELSQKETQDSPAKAPQKPEKGSGVLPEKLRQKLIEKKLYRR